MQGLSKLSTCLIAALAFLFIFIGAVSGFNLPKWFPFSTDHSLREWEDKVFKGRVVYKIENPGPEGFLHAISKASASAIFYRVKERFKAEDYPIISWKWKVTNFPDKERLKDRRGIEKDDYAARVYVIFPSINFLASKALEYVWDEDDTPEAIYDSPYSKNIKLIVAQTGKAESGKWVYEERNIYEDYIRAFGRKPSLKIGAVALMSDADNAGDIAEAYFDDIRVGSKKTR